MHEMIIRENTPQDLPPDVVRSNSRVEDQFDNLSVDLAIIRNRFEFGSEDNHNHNNHSSNIDKTTLQRSDSIHVRLQKYQSAVSGEKEMTDSDTDGPNSEPEEELKSGEKVVFSDLSSLKSQWETASSNGSKDEAEATRDELEELRKKLSLGRSESLKESYERAVKESNTESAANRSDAYVFDTSVKTVSIKEKFEKGFPENETENQRIERQKREREDEIQVLADSESASKEARNMFKQIDVSVTTAPTAQLNGHSNHTNGLSKKLTNGDVVKSGESNGEDLSIDSAQLLERFSYFENLPKEVPKEPQRHQITPPRDVTQVYENTIADNQNPNVIRSSDAIEDIPKVDTTKKMLDKFKALESQTDSQSNAPKPLKRITPPRDYNGENEHKPRETSPERDPNIIKSSLKNEENIEVEPEKARNLKAKFENWSAEVDRENKKNNGYDDEEEFIPHIDTTKNLRAKFEAIKDESKPIDKPKIRVNRFVCETSDNPLDVCYVCRTKLYPMEKLEFSGIRLHKNCFRCIKCKCNLRLDNFTITAEKLYCIPHFKQLFMERGNYDEGFGLEQHKNKWTNKCINNNDLIINNNNNNSHLICDVNANDAHIDYANQSVSDASDASDTELSVD
ncbi:unnamed protein product [Medioppia subpectinata]|uniref:LIM zinc-binding domain-containing protein n=1 Tax=Medioppia subpectinata TaxID=1979941 RepID=A0A7R9Q144_9ACAR|nr:unnamed protein product [Medioppia subpectinata]CAG2108832.1 unnamed protein product [Medioppia subpectinata]